MTAFSVFLTTLLFAIQGWYGSSAFTFCTVDCKTATLCIEHRKFKLVIVFIENFILRCCAYPLEISVSPNSSQFHYFPMMYPVAIPFSFHFCKHKNAPSSSPSFTYLRLNFLRKYSKALIFLINTILNLTIAFIH